MPIVNQANFNATALIAPDLYVVIVPPSQLAINGVPSNIVGMVGLASWGPVNTATQIGSMAQYSQQFGQLANRTYDMGTHVAVASQQGASAFSCVRVTDGTDVAATAAIGTSITFTGKYTGVFGNTVSVTVGSGSKASSYRFTIGAPGYIPEIFDNIVSTPTVVTTSTTAASTASTTLTVASTTGITVGMVVAGTGIAGSPTVSSITSSTAVVVSSAQTVASGVSLTFTSSTNNSVWVALANAINSGVAGRLPSSYVTAVAGAGTSTPSVGTTYALSGGTDGSTTVTSATLIGANTSPATGMYALPPSVGIIDVCDLTDSTQWTTVDAFANTISAYAIQQVPSGSTIAQAVTAKQTAGLDSYNSKLMHGDFLWWNDPVLQTARLVAPQAFVAGRLGNLTPQRTTLNKTIYSVAGSQRTGLVGSGNVVSPYSQTEINTLVLNGIDAVMNPGAGGLNIWTCRHGHNTSSNATIHLDNYPTLTNYIAKTLANGMGAYIGQPITKDLFGNIAATLGYFLQQLAGNGLLSSPDGSVPWNVVCSIANNPPQNTNLGIVVADVQAKYPSINEKFTVNLQGGNTITVSNTSVSNTQ